MSKWMKNIFLSRKGISFTLILSCLLFLLNTFPNNALAIDYDKYVYRAAAEGKLKSASAGTPMSYNTSAPVQRTEGCNLGELKQDYQGSCYSCKVVKLLIETFLTACTKVYDLAKDAGTKLLFYGFMMWMAVFALKNVSSFTSLEPSNNINDLLVFLFKILFAYICINGGLSTFTNFIVNPIIVAGADYGLGVIDGITDFYAKAPQAEEIKYDGDAVVSPYVINKIFQVNRALDYVVSENLVIGEALICHATHAGAWVDTTIITIPVTIPNIFLIICGAAIWFCGFMMTLGVSYYLIDISYKLGFTIMVFPIVLGLWPFGITKDKVKTCFSIILKAGATFAFLSITASYGLALIDYAYGGQSGGIERLYSEIEANQTMWIAETFSITGSYFLILIFAYLYAIRLLPSGVNEFVNKFFKDGVFSSSPMHKQLTQVTDMAKKGSMKAASWGAKKAGGGISKGIGRLANGLIDKAKDGEEGGTTAPGNALKASGKATQVAGKATQAAGTAMDKTGQAMSKGGQAMTKAGAAMSSTVVGSIIGVPLAALGAVTTAGGVAAQATGKATKAAGKVMEKAGKAMEKAGKVMNKAWRTTKKAAKFWKKDK
ncbi:MAG: hypothetical protein PHE89_02400 [Alphaproteobacteria bacterium]|nr:hypothetical protein [Alphaproteobacteria bacterium]